jgi:hypothetical protein
MRSAPKLSDRQRRLIDDAAKAVPLLSRDSFTARDIRHLVGQPSDDAVMASINQSFDHVPFLFADAVKETAIGANK